MGLMRGDVLLNWECSIEPDDTVINLYFKKIYPAAIESVLQVCELYRAGNAPRMSQDESKASYERRCTQKHSRIDWFKPVEQVYNLIRGTNPAPGAWTTHAGSTLGVFDCARVPGDGVAGRVMDISDEGITVQSVGGRILIKRVKPDAQAKQTASEYAASSGLKIGDDLGAGVGQ